LNDEFMEIIERYNIICDIKNHGFSITQIKFTYEDKNITLVIDPNDTKIMTYKDIRKLCEKTNIEFSNQSF